MAQDMTSKYTTPVVRNRSFSIFKSETTGEDTMAVKSTEAAAKAQRQAKLTLVQSSEPEATITEQPTPVAPTVSTAVTELSETPEAATSVADLLTARRALDEQIKAAKSAQPAKPPKPEKPTKSLDDVIAAQLARPRTDVPRIVASYVLAREAAG